MEQLALVLIAVVVAAIATNYFADRRSARDGGWHAHQAPGCDPVWRRLKPDGSWELRTMTGSDLREDQQANSI